MCSKKIQLLIWLMSMDISYRSSTKRIKMITKILLPHLFSSEHFPDVSCLSRGIHDSVHKHKIISIQQHFILLPIWTNLSNNNILYNFHLSVFKIKWWGSKIWLSLLFPALISLYLKVYFWHLEKLKLFW